MEAFRVIFVLSVLLFTIECNLVFNRRWSFKDLIDFQYRHTQSKTKDLQHNCKELVKNCLEGTRELVNGYLNQLNQKKLKRDEVDEIFKELKANITDARIYNETIRKYSYIESSLIKQIDLNAKYSFYTYWTAKESYSGDDEESRCSDKDYESVKVLELLKYTNITEQLTKAMDQSLLKFGSYIDQQVAFNENFTALVEEIKQKSTKKNGANLIGTFLRARTAHQNSSLGNLTKLVAQKGLEAIIILINSGKHFDQAKIILEEVLEFNDQAFAEVLQKSYNCSQANLNNTIQFAQQFDITGLEFVINDIEICSSHFDDSINSVIVEKLRKKIKDKTLENLRQSDNDESAKKVPTDIEQKEISLSTQMYDEKSNFDTNYSEQESTTTEVEESTTVDSDSTINADKSSLEVKTKTTPSHSNNETTSSTTTQMPKNDEDHDRKLKIETAGEKNLTSDVINDEKNLKSIAEEDEKSNFAYLVWIGVICLVVVTSIIILIVMRNVSTHSYAIRDSVEVDKSFKKADKNLYSFPEVMSFKEL